MADYDNSNTGVLFKNDRKTEEKHPDYTGSFYDANGGEYFCDAWIKKSSKTGGSFLSFRVKPKTKQREHVERNDGPLAHSLNDDIPFAPEWR